MKKSLIGIIALIASYAVSYSTVLPSGGVRANGYGPGETVNIRWNDDLETDLIDVCIWNGDKGELDVIASGLEYGLGSYAWTIPSNYAVGDQYRILVRDALNPRRMDISRGWIAIGYPQPIVSSVRDIDLGKDIRCDPFPASSNVRVSWGSRSVTLIDVVDILHNVLLQKEVDGMTHATNLDIGRLASGLFHVRLHGASGEMASAPLFVVK